MSERVTDKSDRAVYAVYLARWEEIHARVDAMVPDRATDAQRSWRFRVAVAWEVEKDWSFPAEQIERVLRRMDLGWDRKTGEPVGVWR